MIGNMLAGMKPLVISIYLAALVFGASPAPAVAATGDATNGANLAVTPPMGFNNWARYECGVSESVMTANADALVSTGLAAKGYNTVTVDDCWMTASRDGSGNLVTNTTKFPHGMAWLGSYLHSRGLKFGIYEDAGTSTCGGYAGSLGHEQADANLFASWGVDYLKYDGCNVPTPSGQTQEQAYRNAYSAMSTALANSGRSIALSESAPAYFCCGSNPSWYSVLGWVAQYGQLWREGYDVAVHSDTNKWSSLMSNYGYNVPLSRYAGPNHWNDPDFLITGDGITDDEARSQMALWSMMAAPLILSTDVGALTPAEVAIAGNADIIAVDQDSLGVQAGVVSQNGSTDVLARPLSGGRRAVSLLNRTASAATVSTTTSAIGFTGGSGCTFTTKDLWTGTTATTSSTISATVPAHGTAIFTVTPSTGCGATQPTGQISGIAGKCADDTGSSTTDGSQIILYSCTGNANQRWTQPGDGTVRTLGKCLTASGTADASNVVLSTCTGASSQHWTYNQNGNLVNAAASKCLDASGGSSADLTKLIVWPCGSHQINQTWSLPV